MGDHRERPCRRRTNRLASSRRNVQRAVVRRSDGRTFPCRYRLVAATLPGHCGTAPPEDFRPEHYARTAGELARDIGADVVVGFSMGATVACEMETSGA